MKQFWSANLLVLAVSGTALLCGLGLLGAGNRELARWVWVGGSAPAFALLLYDTLRALAEREAGVDMLALLSIGGAIALGEYLTGAVIAVMLASGRALESFAQRRAGREMSALLADQVIRCDRLLVRSGDTVPVDGSLTSTLAFLDESTLSGESTPVERREGAPLRSGALNAGASFEMLATTNGAESTFAGIVRLVSAAQSSKARVAPCGPLRAVVRPLVVGSGWSGLFCERRSGARAGRTCGGNALPPYPLRPGRHCVRHVDLCEAWHPSQGRWRFGTARAG